MLFANSKSVFLTDMKNKKFAFVANVEIKYYLCIKGCGMEIKFEQDYLSELYYRGKTDDKQHRFQPQIVKKYIRVIDLMESLESVEDLFRFKSLHYERLIGDKKDRESVRVNNQYRIEFRSELVGAEKTVTICNIMELSNHYQR